MPKGMKSCLRKVEFLQNNVQHATCIPLTDGCSVSSFENPSCSMASQMLRQHPCQYRVDGDGAIALLCLDGDLFAFPDATPDVDSSCRQIQVVNVQAGSLTVPHPCPCQRCEEHLPLAGCSVYDSAHFLRGKETLFFEWNLGVTQVPFPPYLRPNDQLKDSNDVADRLGAEIASPAIP